MKRPVLILRRADLVAARACAEWLGIFDEILAMRGDAAGMVDGLQQRREVDQGRLRQRR